MRTFKQFLNVLLEKKLTKKQEKEVTKGIVVKPQDLQVDSDGTKTYNLSNSPRPVYTNPGSPERKAQIKVIQKNSGASSFHQ